MTVTNVNSLRVQQPLYSQVVDVDLFVKKDPATETIQLVSCECLLCEKVLDWPVEHVNTSMEAIVASFPESIIPASKKLPVTGFWPTSMIVHLDITVLLHSTTTPHHHINILYFIRKLENVN